MGGTQAPWLAGGHWAASAATPASVVAEACSNTPSDPLDALHPHAYIATTAAIATT